MTLHLRQAVKKLNDNKLVVGDLEYKVDIARNKILGHSVNGISINAGQELFEGTTVDLLVGKGVGDDYINMPNLVGLSRVEANIILKTLSLNIGLEIFDSKITDSSTAIITNQKPEYIEGKKLILEAQLICFMSKITLLFFLLSSFFHFPKRLSQHLRAEGMMKILVLKILLLISYHHFLFLMIFPILIFHITIGLIEVF